MNLGRSSEITKLFYVGTFRLNITVILFNVLNYYFGFDLNGYIDRGRGLCRDPQLKEQILVD